MLAGGFSEFSTTAGEIQVERGVPDRRLMARLLFQGVFAPIAATVAVGLVLANLHVLTTQLQVLANLPLLLTRVDNPTPSSRQLATFTYTC